MDSVFHSFYEESHNNSTCDIAYEQMDILFIVIADKEGDIKVYLSPAVEIDGQGKSWFCECDEGDFTDLIFLKANSSIFLNRFSNI